MAGPGIIWYYVPFGPIAVTPGKIMLIRTIALVLLITLQMPLATTALAKGEVEAFKAAYGRYEAALEAKDMEAASDAAGRALELGKQLFPADSPSLLALYVNHGGLLIDLQRSAEALPVLREGVSRFEKEYGKKDQRLIFAKWALAEATGKTGDHDRAIKLLVQVSGMVKKAYGAKTRVFADVQQLLGQEYYLSDSQYKKARRRLSQAHKIYSTLHGDKVYQTGLAALWLGKAKLLERNGVPEAEKHFLEALRIFDATTPKGHGLRLSARSLLIHLYEDTERSDQATGHLLAVAKMRPSPGVDGNRPLYRRSPAYPEAAARMEKEG
ncbi:MAG: tetratricopeptide repeat protein, partial [Sphingomonadales bacterium]